MRSRFALKNKSGVPPYPVRDNYVGRGEESAPTAVSLGMILGALSFETISSLYQSFVLHRNYL